MDLKRTADEAEMEVSAGKRLFLDKLAYDRDWRLNLIDCQHSSDQDRIVSDEHSEPMRTHLHALMEKHKWQALIEAASESIVTSDFSRWRIRNGYPKTMDLQLETEPFDPAMADGTRGHVVTRAVDWFWRQLVHTKLARANPSVSVIPHTELTGNGCMQLHLSCAIIYAD